MQWNYWWYGIVLLTAIFLLGAPRAQAGNGLCGCPEDLDGDAQVDVADLLIMLAEWGEHPGSPADLSEDCTVGVPDLLLLLAAWGPCKQEDSTNCPTIDLIDPTTPAEGGTKLPLLNSGKIVPKPAELAKDGWVKRAGLAADGETLLVIRYKTGDAGDVEFELTDEEGKPAGKEQVGRIVKLDDQNWAAATTKIKVTPVKVGDEHYAFAAIRAPANYVRHGTPKEAADKKSGVRNVILKAKAAGGGANPCAKPKAAVKVELHRPPVVLLHGYCSEANAWQWGITADDRFRVHVYDYGVVKGGIKQSAKSLASNKNVPREAVAETLNKSRKAEVAATQVDVIAHSMGALLTRLYINDEDNYKRKDNFKEGDINRLLMLTAPNDGTPLADKVLTGQIFFTKFRDKWNERFPTCRTDHGAFEELGHKKTKIKATAIPAHALLGTGGKKALESTTTRGRRCSAGKRYRGRRCSQTSRKRIRAKATTSTLATSSRATSMI